MRDTANRQEHSTLDRRPDGSIFFESDEPAFKLSEDELEKAEASQANRRRANFAARKPFIARTSHSLSLAPVEIKYTPGSSGFKVNKDGELELPSNAESVRTVDSSLSTACICSDASLASIFSLCTSIETW